LLMKCLFLLPDVGYYTANTIVSRVVDPQALFLASKIAACRSFYPNDPIAPNWNPTLCPFASK
jgi:hypothetical protein